MWYDITQPSSNNPSPRTVLAMNMTYCIYPVLQNGVWHVGYAFAMDGDMGRPTDLYVYRCTGSAQTRWNNTDEVIITDLKNAGKFSKKLLY